MHKNVGKIICFLFSQKVKKRCAVASVLPALHSLPELLKETPTTKTCSGKKRMHDKLLIHRNCNFKITIGVNQWRSRLQLIMWSTSHVGDNASTVEEQNFAQCVKNKVVNSTFKSVVKERTTATSCLPTSAFCKEASDADVMMMMMWVQRWHELGPFPRIDFIVNEDTKREKERKIRIIITIIRSIDDDEEGVTDKVCCCLLLCSSPPPPSFSSSSLPEE